jgi:hypothetical protein
VSAWLGSWLGSWLGGVTIHQKIERRKKERGKVNNKMAEIIRIPDIVNYLQEIVEGVLILTPRRRYITEPEFEALKLINSTIIECEVKRGDTIISRKKKYQSILNDIWPLLPTQRLLQTTTYNMYADDMKGYNGYYWSSVAKMSVQRKDANGAMKEILHMVRMNRYTMDISIRLELGQIIYFKIE